MAHTPEERLRLWFSDSSNRARAKSWAIVIGSVVGTVALAAFCLSPEGYAISAWLSQ